MNGEISQEFTAWCKRCSHWEQTGGKKARAIREFKRHGWKKIHGSWYCADCLKEAKK